METGYVRLNPNQYFPGSCFFIAKQCVREVHHLPRPTRQLHLAELAEVVAAVEVAFAPTKLNYESLGNSVPHLHWWIAPRSAADARPQAPIWEDLDFLKAQWTEGARPTDSQLAECRSLLLAALKSRDLLIEQPTG